MAELLAVGTYVRVTPQPWQTLDGVTHPADPPYVGKVRGYDLGHTKYQISERVAGWGRWLFADGGRWEFPRVVEEIGEEEALRVNA